MTKPRYTVIEGSYRGAGDDVAGRWYLVDERGDAIDKRGRGFASREEALDRLVERLTMAPMDTDLVGVTEIAQRSGAAVATVKSWLTRRPDFPTPIVRLAMGPVWEWSDVAAWLALPRTAGRPRKER